MTCIIGYRRTGADPAAADENETQASSSENQLDGTRLGIEIPLAFAKGRGRWMYRRPDRKGLYLYNLYLYIALYHHRV